MASVALTSTYSTAGSWTFTCPAGVTSLLVACTGGGGGGGAASATAGSNGGGGGGGEAALEAVVAVSAGKAYTVTVGAGGPGGTSGAAGTAGGVTTFAGDALTVTANGGAAGTAAVTGAGQGGLGGTGSANSVSARGGAGADGVVSSTSGGGGGAAGSRTTGGVVGHNAVLTAGGAASGGTYPGGAGAAGRTTTGDGAAGSSPGGGGSGGLNLAAAAHSGGNGADGQVVLVCTMTDPVTLSATTDGSVTTFTAPLSATTVTAQAWGGGGRGAPAAGVAVATPNLVGGGNLVGCTVQPRVYSACGTSWVCGTNTIDTLVSQVSYGTTPAGPRRPAHTIQKIYLGSPLTASDGRTPPQNVRDLTAAGVSILACTSPPQTRAATDLTRWIRDLQAWIAYGVSFDVIIYQECNGGHGFTGAADYINLVQFYWDTLDPVTGKKGKDLGLGLVYDPSFSGGQSSAISFFPTNVAGTVALPNAITCDWYCVSGWTSASGNNLTGSAPQHPLDPVAQLADTWSIPFGLGEWGITATPTPPAALWSSGAWDNYVQYIISFFRNRPRRYACLWYAGDHNTTFNELLNTGNTNNGATGLAKVWDALTTGASGGQVAAAGGGGGEYAQEASLGITGGRSYVIGVGSGGTSSRSNGGNSTIAGDSVTVTANGGLAPTSATAGGGGGSGSANTTHHDGGSGGAGGLTTGGGGGGGGSGGTAAMGNAGRAGTTTQGGAGGAAVSGGGPGGAGGGPAGSGAAPPTGPGGGGGGRGVSGTFNGGGADGQVTLSSFVTSGVQGTGSMALAGGAVNTLNFAGQASSAQVGGFALASGAASTLGLAGAGNVCQLSFVQAGAETASGGTAIGTPYKVGGAITTSGTTFVGFTVGTPTNTGDAIVAFVASGSGSNNISSVADSKSNTYVAVGSPLAGTSLNGQWFVALNATALTTSDILTAGYANTSGSKTISVFACSGVLTAAATDQTPAPASGTSTAPSVTSGVLAQASELALAGELNANPGGALTWGGSFASPAVSDTEHTGATYYSNAAAIVTSSTGALTASGTITSANWAIGLITLKGAAGGTGNSVTLPCAASQPGSLLVASVAATDTVNLTGPAGWTRITGVTSGTAGRSEAWFYNPSGDGVTATNPGGLTGGTWTCTAGKTLRGQIVEYAPSAGSIAVLDGTPATLTGGTGTTSFNLTQTAGNGPAQGGDTGFACFQDVFSASSAGTWTAPAGWATRSAATSSADCHAVFTNCLLAGAQNVTATFSTSVNQTGFTGLLFEFGTRTVTGALGGIPLAGLGLSGTGTSGVPAGTVATSGAFALGSDPTAVVLAFQSPSTAITFPSSSLPVMAEIQVNGTFVDISDQVYLRDGINITGRGRADEASTPQPGFMTLTLDNRSGNFSPQNASGLYFPYLTRNIQIRVSVQNATTPKGAWYTGYRFWGQVVAWPPLWNLSGTDVYASITCAGVLQRIAQSKSQGSALKRYYGNLTGGLIPAGYWTCEDGNGAAQFSSGISGSLPAGSFPLTWGVNPPSLAADSNVAGSAPFAQLGGPTGASSWTGTVGGFTAGGQTVNVPGTYAFTCPGGVSTIFAECWGAGGGGGNGQNGAGGGGAEYAAEPALAVTPGNTYAYTVSAGGQGGAGSFSGNGLGGADGLRSTFTGDTKTVIAHGGKGAGGHAADPPAAGGTGSSNTTHHDGGNGAAASGHYGGGGGGSSGGSAANGNAGTQSAGTTGGQAGLSVIDGGPGGTGGNGATAAQGLTATPGFAPNVPPGGGGGGGGFSGGNSYAKPGGPGAPGQVRYSFGAQAAVPSANVLRAVVDIPAAGGVTGAYYLQALTSGTVADFHVIYSNAGGGSFQFVGKDINGNDLFNTNAQSFSANGQPMMLSLELTQVGVAGANIKWAMRAIKPGAATSFLSFTGTIAGNLGLVSIVEVNNHSPTETGAVGIGHVALQYQYQPLGALGAALGAFSGELAADRLTRLCGENNIPFALNGLNTDTPQMGPQPVDVLINLLQDCENADLGQLFSTRDQFGLGYQTRQNMQNPQPAAVLDYSLHQLGNDLAPTDDDQLTRNDIIASRLNGGFYEAVLATGPMSTADPPAGVGLYQYSVTPNLLTDAQLAGFATWLLTLGTVDEYRYPTITIDLRRATVAGDVFSQVANLDITDSVQIINPPSWLPPFPINQLCFGFTEILNVKEWTITINAVPADPWAGTNFPVW